jgi:hypothetical protein
MSMFVRPALGTLTADNALAKNSGTTLTSRSSAGIRQYGRAVIAMGNACIYQVLTDRRQKCTNRADQEMQRLCCAISSVDTRPTLVGRRIRASAGLFASRHRSAAGGFLGALLAAFLSPTAASADDQDKTGTSAFGESAAQSSVQSLVDQPAGPSNWTISVEGIVLQRLGVVNQTLVARVPGSVPFLATAIAPGAEAFNSNQFRQVFSAGPKLRLMYNDASGYGVELSYFNTFGRSVTESVGPDSPPNWLVMRAPGRFWQTQDFPYQAMAWSSSTKLYNAELDGRVNLFDRVTVLAGFRWLQLQDDLTGTLPPPDRSAPRWKTTCPLCNLFQVTAGGPIGALPPFWNTATVNNLYGVQVGVDGTLLEFGRLSLGGRMTVGVFDNNAEQSTGVSIAKVVYPTTATKNGLAVVSEAGLQLKYRVTTGLALKAGYNVLWLVGVALAPGQINETYAARSDVRAFGVNRGSNVVFQGATFGLEYTF